MRKVLDQEHVECRQMVAKIEVLPAAVVTFHDGRKTRTAFLTGGKPGVQLDGREEIFIRVRYIARLLCRTVITADERRDQYQLLGAVIALLLVVATTGLFLN